jgi:hypothetical protein
MTTEDQTDDEWLTARLGYEVADEQLEIFCERVSIIYADLDELENSRLRAFDLQFAARVKP